MKIMEIFKNEDWKRSRKIKALEKVMDKLKKKKGILEDELKSESSKKKAEKLKIKLKANKHHRHKAEKLIRELD